MTPPTRPQPPLVDDGYLVEPEPVVFPFTLGPRRDREPIRHEFAWLGLGVCVGIVIFALVVAIVQVATPSSGQTTDPVDLSGTSSAALSGAPLLGVVLTAPMDIGAPLPAVASAASEPIASMPALITGLSAGPYQSDVGTALIGGWATFCDPSPERCQAWGPPALLGAAPWFRDGDRPQPVEVCVDDGTRCLVVTVVSFCACGARDGIPTVIDLSPAALEQLDLDYRRLGVVFVTIEWPVDELPATDTGGEL